MFYREATGKRKELCEAKEPDGVKLMGCEGKEEESG